MPSEPLINILTLVAIVLLPSVGWLIKTVVDLKATVAALKDKAEWISSDTNRRFREIGDSLQQINAKLDRLVERGHDSRSE